MIINIDKMFKYLSYFHWTLHCAMVMSIDKPRALAYPKPNSFHLKQILNILVQ